MTSGNPALRPSGQPAAVQNCSGQSCRTTEGASQQVYRLPPLAARVSFQQFLNAAWVPLRNSCSSRKPDPAHPRGGFLGHPAPRVAPLSRRVQRNSAETNQKAHQQVRDPLPPIALTSVRLYIRPARSRALSVPILLTVKAGTGETGRGIRPAFAARIGAAPDGRSAL
jgi:hypothetical protein